LKEIYTDSVKRKESKISFIFSPCPYEDESAINHVENIDGVSEGCAFGYPAVVSRILGILQHDDLDIIGIDGAPAADFHRFGRLFPIRFSYDDTFHSSGNMSIQCHPGDAFCKSHFGEYGRQDEGYYVVATGHDAKTYLGFKNGVKVDDFCDMARKSETDKTNRI